jgi:hypothetical protein
VSAGEASTILLADDALAGIGGIRQVSDIPGPDGQRLVTVAWTSPEGTGESTFAVERIGTRFGLFPEWGFAESPVATLQLGVLHDQRFTVNGMPAVTGEASNAAAAYAVLVPGAYVIDHESPYLEAAAVTVLAGEVGAVLPATVDVQANDRFLAQLTQEVYDHLAGCATQQVLFPSSCPLGHAIPNRIVSTPTWSIVADPDLTIQPGREFGTWFVPPADATAHLLVDVQSIFDGSVSTFDEDVPFEVSYVITITSDTTLRIVPQG